MSYDKKHGNDYVRNVFTLFLSFCLSLSFLAVIPVNAQQTVVSVSPSTLDVSHYSNSGITLNVRIDDVSNFYGFQFDVTYDQNVLRLAPQNNVTEGNFLKSDGAATYWVSPNRTTLGLIDNIASTRRTTTTSVSGSGNLAQG